jgi:rRNA maturation endonuclease Nob1
MIWNNPQDIGARRTAERAISKAESHAADISDMRRQVERLSLACQSMWELLRDRSEITEDDLVAKMTEIDGRDGRVDGKISIQFTTCDACGKPSNSRRDFCLMCGEPFLKEHQFKS